MLVHLFQCSRSGLHGAARSRSGDELPSDPGGGEWRYVRDVELEADEQRLAIDSTAAIADIRTNGYHLLAGWYPRL